jgi:uroporphyrinogen III methyltransferase / synthase
VVGEVVGVRERLSWFERRPLHGRRILLLATDVETELPPRSDAVEVVRVSPLQVVPRISVVQQSLGRPAQIIALTSKHAVDALMGALAASAKDVRSLHGVKLAVVGEATRRRLAEFHLLADVVSSGGGEELARKIVNTQEKGSVRVLGAAGGRPELGDALGAAGFEVDVVAAYDTVPNQEALSRVAHEHRERPFDAIGFASPKGVEAFLDRVGALGPAKLGAIGATTSAALEARGLSVDAVPAEPSLSALVDALARKIE